MYINGSLRMDKYTFLSIIYLSFCKCTCVFIDICQSLWMYVWFPHVCSLNKSIQMSIYINTTYAFNCLLSELLVKFRAQLFSLFQSPFLIALYLCRCRFFKNIFNNMLLFYRVFVFRLCFLVEWNFKLLEKCSLLKISN